jgi:hypothetical protein
MRVVLKCCQRNVIFADLKPRILALRLCSQSREAYIPAEVWDAFSFTFVLPLC